MEKIEVFGQPDYWMAADDEGGHRRDAEPRGDTGGRAPRPHGDAGGRAGGGEGRAGGGRGGRRRRTRWRRGTGRAEAEGEPPVLVPLPARYDEEGDRRERKRWGGRRGTDAVAVWREDDSQGQSAEQPSGAEHGPGGGGGRRVRRRGGSGAEAPMAGLKAEGAGRGIIEAAFCER
ncbi:hypothetical protein BS78_02G373300 [Paspalum vaginatum]|nr:hypothetical protein BS78_02G373300 [Paspalum vaginatum]